MDCIKNGSSSEGSSEKKDYEPPKAMRLGDMRNGAGVCSNTGSGDGESCSGDGNSAAGGCFGDGNNVSL
ncbi:MAG: hypothetical protein WCP70_02655 [Methanothrix sp.]